jgi:DNA-binding transcriptional regulator YiaG
MFPRKCGATGVNVMTPAKSSTSSVTQSAALRLRRARAEAGLTQEETARLCRCGLRTVQRRELGQVDLGSLEQLLALEQVAERKAA